MPNTYWKVIARRVARLFGTERIGVREGGPAPDFENTWVVGEVVCHPVPRWLLRELAQTERRPTDLPKLRLEGLSQGDPWLAQEGVKYENLNRVRACP